MSQTKVCPKLVKRVSASELCNTSLYKNEGGVIKTIDDFDVFFNIKGKIIKMPKKENLVLDIHPMSFVSNNVAGSSVSCSTNYAYWNYNSRRTTFGNYNNNTAGSSLGNGHEVCNCRDGYFYIGANYRGCNFAFPPNSLPTSHNLFLNQRMTVNIYCKVYNHGIWSNFVALPFPTLPRIEIGQQRQVLFYIDNGGSIPITENLDREYHMYSIVISNDGITCYFDGEPVGSLNVRLPSYIMNLIRLNYQRDNLISSNIEYRAVQCWRDALTASEIKDMWYLIAYDKWEPQPDKLVATDITSLRRLINENRGHLERIDTSQITDMTHLQYDHMINDGIRISDMTNEDWNGVAEWDMSNVTSIESMFWGEFNQPIGKWDTRSLRNMDCLFYGDVATFNQPLDNWNVENLETAYDAFFISKFDQPLPSWKPRKLVQMQGMFAYHNRHGVSMESWRPYLAGRHISGDPYLDGYDLETHQIFPVPSWVAELPNVSPLPPAGDLEFLNETNEEEKPVKKTRKPRKPKKEKKCK